MNKERILALADLVEQQPHVDGPAKSGFNMNRWTHSCGAPACIAGWTTWMGKLCILDETYEAVAGEYLGLDRKDAHALFLPPTEIDYDAITPQQAAETLRHLVKTGKVDWSHVEAES